MMPPATPERAVLTLIRRARNELLDVQNGTGRMRTTEKIDRADAALAEAERVLRTLRDAA